MRTIYFAFILIIVSSCTKENIGPYDYFKFGKFHGFCEGEQCIEIFKLENGKLYEDQKDNYPKLEKYNGSFDKMSDSKYDLVKNIVNTVPSELDGEENQTFGCPDCLDQGGIFIEYKKSGKVKYWQFDYFEDQNPAYLHDFLSKTKEYIALISD